MISFLSESSLVPTMQIQEVVGLHDQPYLLYGIEVGGVVRKVERLKESQLRLLRLCQEALSRIRIFLFRVGLIDCATSSGKTWKPSVSQWLAAMAKNSPVRGKAVRRMLRRIWSPLWITRGRVPFIANSFGVSALLQSLLHRRTRLSPWKFNHL